MMIGLSNQIGFYKQGSGIHIKKKNRGKFTDYCNGKVTSECIARGKKSKNPLTRKRATFAANARRWKHEDGSKIHKPFGHRSISDNGSISTKQLKKKHRSGDGVSIHRLGGIIKGLDGIPGINFRKRAKKELSEMAPGLSRVEASELNDSIQAKDSYISKIGQYKTAVRNPNTNFFQLKRTGMYPLDEDPLYFSDFDSDMAKQIYNYGRSKGLSDKQLATIIEAGWRETNLGNKVNPAAHGIWQFDKASGTYDQYKKWLRNNKDTWKSQFDYLITQYMPSRDDGIHRFGYKNIWNDENSSLEDLAKYFLIEVETPKDRNKLLDRTKRAVRTIYSNLQ